MESSWTLTDDDCSRLFVIAELLASYGPDAPHVQVDLVAVADLHEGRDQFELMRPQPQINQLSDAVNPLVIDSAGRCFPFVYGIDQAFELGRLTPGSRLDLRPSPAMLAPVASLLETAFHDAEQKDIAYLDWFAYLARVSRQAGKPRAQPLVSARQ